MYWFTFLLFIRVPIALHFHLDNIVDASNFSNFVGVKYLVLVIICLFLINEVQHLFTCILNFLVTSEWNVYIICFKCYFSRILFILSGTLIRCMLDFLLLFLCLQIFHTFPISLPIYLYSRYLQQIYLPVTVLSIYGLCIHWVLNLNYYIYFCIEILFVSLANFLGNFLFQNNTFGSIFLKYINILT